MDYDKLINRLKAEGSITDYLTLEITDLELLDEAATALSALQAENAQLRRRLNEAISVCSRIAEWAQNTGHDYVEGIVKEFLEED